MIITRFYAGDSELRIRPAEVECDLNKGEKGCRASFVYPEVKVETPNAYYARLLMEDHAGLVSELSAITQYLYHHQLLMPKYSDVAELLECIAQVEMKHMELLGEAIVKLGGKPKYGVKHTGEIKWWKGENVYYGYDLCDMLSADIEGEKEAIAQYQKHMEMIDDKFIKRLLARIIEDENEHIRLLKDKFNKYCKSRASEEF